jgi:hypothetical protein
LARFAKSTSSSTLDWLGIVHLVHRVAGCDDRGDAGLDDPLPERLDLQGPEHAGHGRLVLDGAGDELAWPVCRQGHVRVHEEQPVSAGLGLSDVERVGLAEPPLAGIPTLHDLQARICGGDLAEDLAGPVRGSVVHHHHLERSRPVCGQRRADAAADVGLLVARGDDDRQRRCRRREGVGRIVGPDREPRLERPADHVHEVRQPDPEQQAQAGDGEPESHRLMMSASVLGSMRAIRLGQPGGTGPDRQGGGDARPIYPPRSFAVW